MSYPYVQQQMPMNYPPPQYATNPPVVEAPNYNSPVVGAPNYNPPAYPDTSPTAVLVQNQA